MKSPSKVKVALPVEVAGLEFIQACSTFGKASSLPPDASLQIVGSSGRLGSPAKAGVAKAESAKQVAAANMNNRFLKSTTPKTVLYPVRIPDKFR